MKIVTLPFVLASSILCTTVAQANGISNDAIRIGFITDMSGVYADTDGPGGVLAIKMAIEEAGGNINGKPIELLTADHQNRADIAASKAREWIDQNKVDVIIGGTNSATTIAMMGVAAEKKVPVISVGAGATSITSEHCTPYTIHYAYNTQATAYGVSSAVLKQGGKDWFFITSDYAFGHALQKTASDVVNTSGGKSMGNVLVPLNTADFSSYMLQAQTSGAKILGLANAGNDFIGSIKAAHDFGVTSSMRIAGLQVYISDVHALGLDATQGMYRTSPWYWNQDDASRTWSKKFHEKQKTMPTFNQAGNYSAVSNYLKAVNQTGTDDGATIMGWFKSTPISDMYIKNGKVRENGLMVHDMFLHEVKTPADSKEPWDYFNIISTIPGEEAFGPESMSTCKLKSA
ncbi:MAG: ABC transporter substrate-binding protein [Alcaligenaceae bacterium]|nr:ABC transporter substrate-binding protein [Alcaligenaceae bacterium]